MHCTMCRTMVETNPMSVLDEATYDLVVSKYTLIHLTGPDDEFDTEGTVVVCEQCIDKAGQSDRSCIVCRDATGVRCCEFGRDR